MLTEFSQLNLRPELLQAVNELGYEKPTPNPGSQYLIKPFTVVQDHD